MLLLNNFCPVIWVQKESDELLCIWFGHSLWSAISCQRKRLIELSRLVARWKFRREIPRYRNLVGSKFTFIFQSYFKSYFVFRVLRFKLTFPSTATKLEQISRKMIEDEWQVWQFLWNRTELSYCRLTGSNNIDDFENSSQLLHFFFFF